MSALRSSLCRMTGRVLSFRFIQSSSVGASIPCRTGEAKKDAIVTPNGPHELTYRSFLSSCRSSDLKSRGIPLFSEHSLGSPLIQSASPDKGRVVGVRHRSNRSRRGLYDGKDIRSGNNRSFSMRKTKRKFRPNVFIKRVYSETLDEMVRFHLTASALRSIDKAGGLDNYLLTSKYVQEGEGLAAKKRILKKMKQNENCKGDTTLEPKTADNESS